MSCQGDAFDALSAAQQQLVTFPIPYAELPPSWAAWGQQQASGMGNYSGNASYASNGTGTGTGSGDGSYGGGYDGATSKAVCLWLRASWLPTIEEDFDNVFHAFALLFEMG